MLLTAMVIGFKLWCVSTRFHGSVLESLRNQLYKFLVEFGLFISAVFWESVLKVWVSIPESNIIPK